MLKPEHEKASVLRSKRDQQATTRYLSRIKASTKYNSATGGCTISLHSISFSNVSEAPHLVAGRQPPEWALRATLSTTVITASILNRGTACGVLQTWDDGEKTGWIGALNLTLKGREEK